MTQTRTAADWLADYLAAGGSYGRRDDGALLLGWINVDNPTLDKAECDRLARQVWGDPQLAQAVEALVAERTHLRGA